jgi:CHAT domain-containing protein/Tfp pilus assembly protein PilF
MDVTEAVRRANAALQAGMSVTDLVRMGEAHEARGDLEAAEEQYELVLALGEPPGDVAAALYDLGRLYGSRRSDLDRAKEYYTAALELAEDTQPGSKGVATVLQGLGDVHLRRGDLEKAQGDYERALGLLERATPESDRIAALGIGHVHNRLGAVCYARGDFDRAEEHSRCALEIFEKLEPGSPNAAGVLGTLGAIYAAQGHPDRAEDIYVRVVEHLEQTAPQSGSLPLVLDNLGLAYHRRGDFDRAKDVFAAVVERLERRAPYSGGMALALYNLGLAHGAGGELGRAEEEVHRALDLLERGAGPGSRWVAKALMGLVGICFARDDLDGAREYQRRALEIEQQLAPESQGVAQALVHLGSIYRVRAELDPAVETLQRAVAVVESLRTRAGSSGKAREQLFAQYQSPFQALIAALAERRAEGDAEAAFAYAERSRARALVELLAERRVEIRTDSPEQEALLSEERSLQYRLAAAYNRLATARSDPGQAGLAPDLEAEESRLAAELEDLQNRVRGEFGAYAEIEYPEPLGVEGAQALLEPGTLLIEYDATGTETFLWALRRERFEMLALEASGERIAELVEEAVGPYRRGEDAAEEAEEARAELAKLLLGPVPEPLWAGCERLLVVPDGALHYLPFEILPAPREQEATLIGRYPIAYAPSATALASILRDQRPRSERREFVGFGDPEFDGAGDEEGEAEHRFASRGLALSPLRATRKEVEGIARGFAGPAETYLGPEATEFRAKRETEGARFVHFSTHGLLDDRNPLYSGLALSPPRSTELEEDDALDDCLQVYEMFGLCLSAEAVVCSACQTGLGTIHAGEGLVGMSRALFFAGARCVVVSLWPVPNVLTARLMERFYSELQGGLPLAEALREAKLALRSRYPDPFNWAAFVAVGVGW